MFETRLKQLRNELNITQQELADDLKISKGSIAMYETGKRSPDKELLAIIADYFNVSIDYLLGRTNIKRVDTEIISFSKNDLDTEGLTAEDVEMVRSIIDNLKKKNESQKK